MNYQRINTLCGWFLFIVSAIFYLLTVEPSVSFWDCPEFILSASKLEVGHPPGAPFFMLIGNLFSHFTTDITQVALMINRMNAIMSALTILFLFWTITYLVKRLWLQREEPLLWQIVVIMGGGAVGALAYTFSDTFWFSAVEGEVYAFSSLLTALIFWMILKWEQEHDSPSSDRWIVAIVYIIGISIGVHLLNLLCIPALILVIYYTKQQRHSIQGTVGMLLFSAFLVAIILYGIVPGIAKMAGYFELMIVNGMGAPFNSGTLFYFIVLISLLSFCVYVTRRQCLSKNAMLMLALLPIMLGIVYRGSIGQIIVSALLIVGGSFFVIRYLKDRFRDTFPRIIHTLSMSVLVLVMGYSCYALILIRANANIPMNQQSVKDPFSLSDYLGREQYGESPLLYGNTFRSQQTIKRENGQLSYDYKEGAPQYYQDNVSGQYIQKGFKLRSQYQAETCMLFPRMHSPGHENAYLSYIGNFKGRNVNYYNALTNENEIVTIPTMRENLRFFFSYQLNFMYWRYFMWNFVGRQNDIQGHGEIEHGNWITGFTLIDNFLVGNRELLPDDMKNNKGNNVYYALPLLLGLLGIWWQTRNGEQGKQQLLIVFMLFFMTGLAIVVYLNQTPFQPRERDYAYAGSFYAFAIWIGIGAAVLIKALTECCNKWNIKFPMACISTIFVLCVPLQMASQSWDDHDRSNRYLCHTTGNNFLMSLQDEGNPILFVYGDNDTFPSWYMINHENKRDDVRACNLMYLSGGWYVNQMLMQAHNSPPFPLSIDSKIMCDESFHGVEVNPVISRKTLANGAVKEMRIKDFLIEYYANNPGTSKWGDDPFEWKNIVKYWLNNSDTNLRCIPTDIVHFDVDSKAVNRSGMTIPENVNIPTKMKVEITNKNYLMRPGLVLLDLISGCNWERPIYFTTTTPKDEFLKLSDYLVQEGTASRLVPFNASLYNATIDTRLMYKNVMDRFTYRGLTSDNVYLDETNRNMARYLQNSLLSLAEQLYEQNNIQQLTEVMKIIETNFNAIEDNSYTGNHRIGMLLYECGLLEQAESRLKRTLNSTQQHIDWYNSLSLSKSVVTQQRYMHYLFSMQQMLYDMSDKKMLFSPLLTEMQYSNLTLARDKMSELNKAGYQSKLQIENLMTQFGEKQMN